PYLTATKNPGIARVSFELRVSVYGVMLAPPAKIAPSRPTTTTSSFFMSTTPIMIPRKPRRGLPLVRLTLPPPASAVNRSRGHPVRPVGSERTFVLEVELDGVRGSLGPRLDLQLA